MKLLLLLCSFLMLNVACSTPKEEYKEQQEEAREDYDEDLSEAKEEYQEAQKEEAVDYIDESEGAEVKKDDKRIDVKE